MDERHKKGRKVLEKNWKSERKKKKFWNENVNEDQIYTQQKVSQIDSAKQKKKYQEMEDKVKELSRQMCEQNQKTK